MFRLAVWHSVPPIHIIYVGGIKLLYRIMRQKKANQFRNGLVRRSASGVGSVSEGGLTLVEVMLAIAILIIALVGTSLMYASGRRFLVGQQHYRMAVQLASQKLEQLKASGYDNIAEGEEEREFLIDGLTYLRHTQVELTADPTADMPMPCKKATVTTVWSSGADQHETQLVIYIGP
jgi:Tfp pilus assembly protein PilV